MGVKQVTNINWAVAGSVVVGIALFGAMMYAVRRVPTNAVTAPLKTAAEIAATS